MEEIFVSNSQTKRVYTISPIPFVIVIGIMSVVIMWLVFRLNHQNNKPQPPIMPETTVATTTEETVEQTTKPLDQTESTNNNSIAIPGYEGISFSANQKKQNVSLPNPAENKCLFRMSLILADGTVIWTSEMVNPGEISAAITLNQELSVGNYANTVLKYECFTMDGKDALNGAETKLTLWVN